MSEPQNTAAGAQHEFFASCAKGVEPVLEEELRGLGISGASVTAGGVRFSGTVAAALRACLWSRTASRILLAIGRFPANTADDVYGAARSIQWEDHIGPAATMAVDFSGSGAGIDNTMYGAQRIKDGVVDRLRERRGSRPSVAPARPDFLINCRVFSNKLDVRIDLSGGGLHARGYRRDTVAAPLRENLAAALLIKAGWPAIAAAGGPFLDPLCGSGTFVIEAALIAADSAPGLYRERWGFRGWSGFDPGDWRTLIGEANARREEGLKHAPPCVGYDGDKQAVKAARHNAKYANVERIARFETRMLDRAAPVEGAGPGMLLTNPPYGIRMGGKEDLGALYAGLGDTLKSNFPGWTAGVFTAEPDLGKRMGLRARRVNAFYNGAVPCTLLQFHIEPDSFVDRDALDRRAAEIGLERALERGGDAFLNRLKKNARTVGRWARQAGIECYRLYDADLPEYAVAIDIYRGRAVVQEYAAPKTIDEKKAEERLHDALTVIPHALGIKNEDLVFKVRRRQKGADQYRKLEEGGDFMEVREGPCRLLVNLTDYLDTGLFLDHRMTREMIGRLAEGKRFLNLFCYTAAATAHAALGGAVATVSVDMSATYIEWARRNLALNGISERTHRLVRDDCRKWISGSGERFDLIFLDPPTFSNSKRMEGTFDVQRDHAALIRQTAGLLAPGGTLLFSTNRSKFKLEEKALGGLIAEEITAQTIPRDFERNPKIHRCWRIVKAAQSK